MDLLKALVGKSSGTTLSPILRVVAGSRWQSRQSVLENFSAAKRGWPIPTQRRRISRTLALTPTFFPGEREMPSAGFRESSALPPAAVGPACHFEAGRATN